MKGTYTLTGFLNCLSEEFCVIEFSIYLLIKYMNKFLQKIFSIKYVIG